MNRQLRIAIVANANSIHTIRWVSWLEKKGHLVKTYSLQENPSAIYFGPEPPLNRKLLLNLGSGVRKTTKLLQNAIDEFKPNLIHGFFLTNHGFYASRIKNYPIVVTALGSDVLLAPSESKILNWITKKTVKNANVIISVAKHMTDVILSWGVSKSKIVTSPLGIDSNIFKPLEKEKTILFSRGFKEVYDPLTLMKSIPEVLHKIPNVNFVLCGTGEFIEECKEYVNKNKLIDSVEFLGHVPNNQLTGLVGKASVLVSPSLSDGAPVSVLEGLACGCVIVATDIPANRAWVYPNENGLLFKPRNSINLSEALITALTNKKLKKNAFTQGPKLIFEKANWEKEIKRVTKEYFNLINFAK